MFLIWILSERLTVLPYRNNELLNLIRADIEPKKFDRGVGDFTRIHLTMRKGWTRQLANGKDNEELQGPFKLISTCVTILN